MNAPSETTHACCHSPAAMMPATARAHGDHVQSSPAPAHPAKADSWRAAASVTVHCLTGCAIGEFIGLAVGVSLGLPIGLTIALAVVLSFISGFALTLLPMLRRGFDIAAALRTVWLGEVISISVMELVMNLVDYRMGGMRGVSLASAQYWQAFAMAMIAGYLAAWPVNRWMLSRNMKNCH